MIKIKNCAIALTFLLSTTLQSFASYTPSHKNSPLERGGSEADGVCCAQQISLGSFTSGGGEIKSDGVCCTQQISPPLLHKNLPPSPTISNKDDSKLSRLASGKTADANQVAGLYASNTADINVDGTTTLIGGAITANELNLTTSDLVVKDLKIHDTSKDVSIGVGVNLNNFDDNEKNNSNSYGNISYQDKGHTLEGEINSTIASNSGTITIGGKQVSDTELEARGVNTDLDKIHIITKDENWDRDLSVELVNMGVAKEQVKDITNVVKSITATVPDKIKAQGPLAESFFRKTIAEGYSIEEALQYTETQKYRDLLAIREYLEAEKKKNGSYNVNDVYVALKLELAGITNYYNTNCASAASDYGPCRDLASILSKEAGMYIDANDNLTSETIGSMIASYKGLLENTTDSDLQIHYSNLINLAVQCEALLIQDTGDTSPMKDLPADKLDEKLQDLENAGIDSVAYGYRLRAIDIANDPNLSVEEKKEQLKELSGKLDGLRKSDEYKYDDKDLKETHNYIHELKFMFDYGATLKENVKRSCEKDPKSEACSAPQWMLDHGYRAYMPAIMDPITHKEIEKEILTDDGSPWGATRAWDSFFDAFGGTLRLPRDIAEGEVKYADVKAGLAYLKENPGLIDDVLLEDVYRELEQGDYGSALGYTVEIAGVVNVASALGKAGASGAKLTTKAARDIIEQTLKRTADKELINDAWSWVDNAASGGIRLSSDHPLKDTAIIREGTDARPVLNQGNTPTCGPTSCKMVLDTQGNPVDLDKLIEASNVNKNGMSMNDLPKVLKNFGVNASSQSRQTIADIANYTQNGNPVIVRIKYPLPGNSSTGHAIVVDGVTKRNGVDVVAIRDPHGVQYFSPVSEFQKHFSGQVIKIGD